MSKVNLKIPEFQFRDFGYLLLVSIIVSLSLSSYSQSKQGSYWYFGQHAGVKFNASGTITAQTNGATTAATNLEGTATISDTAGNLLFYTDGMTVWNKNHVAMTNGTGLLGHSSSTQSGVIVPHPRSTDTFFIFTIDAAHNNLANGLRYSVVKMSLSGGLGAVTTPKNILLSGTGILMAEKITAVKHCNNRDIWVISHGYGAVNGNKFYAYLITPSGVTTTPVISTVGTTHNYGDVNGYGNARGYMKASADGKKIALAIPYDGCPYPPGNVNTWTQGSVEVFDLDTRTGVVSNSIKFTSALYKGSYGLEFSPGGNRLYASQWGGYNDPSTIYQWNLLAGSPSAVQASATLIATASPSPGALQLALNGKIYVVKYNGANLDAINFPNNLGAACGYTTNAVALGATRYGMYGLPTFISSYFNPGYNVLPTFVASPASFVIDDTTQLDSVYWTFGDPTSGANNHSKLFNPQHTYLDTGTYRIQLIMYKCGVADTLRSWLPVYPIPNAVFSVNDSDQCLKGNSFTFTNASTISAGTMTYLWKFGDNTTSTLRNPPAHVYATAGNRTVWLIVTSAAGGKDSVSKNIFVRAQPVSGFNINNNSQCLSGNRFEFQNTTSGATSYLWNFGDAVTTALTSPSHTYTTAGNFNVRLVSTSSFGCKDTINKSVEVRPQPVSGFTINNNSQCLSGNNFAFTNTTTGAATYLWNFGDAATSNATTPSHSYSTAGAFSVKLIATTSYGCKDSITKGLNVRPQPVSAFTINNISQCLSVNNFAFTNTSTGAATYLWRFGDATTSLTTSPSHSYLAVGTYSVKLIATTTFGCKDSIAKSVDVRAQPTSGFTINNSFQCLTGNSFTFTNSSTNATSYLWKFGDASTSAATSPSHSYLTTGTFSVKLIASTIYGCKDSISKNIEVRPQPILGFTINNNSQCFSVNNFGFTNTTTGALSYLWRFGDGSTSAVPSPSHSYTSTGTFSVKLIATTTYGCKDSTTKTLDVRPQPGSGFTINNNSQCLTGNNFAFTNTSSGAATYLWRFGDATTSNATSPNHSYTSTGTFSVKLVATTSFGCKDSVTKTLDVRPKPVVGYTINNNSQCLSSNNFGFTNTTTGASTYLWNFGDGFTSLSTSPTHSYTSAGVFYVKLIATSSYGCKDSIGKNLDVRSQPISSFTINNNSQCLPGNSFSFTNTTAGIATYLWRFGDAATSTLTSPSHSYVSAGAYSVKLISTTSFGCKDSIAKSLDVRPQPVSGFTINNNSQCLSANNFGFTNTSTGAATSLWKFGDAATSSITSPSHSYATTGVFTVKLISTTSFGCKDSIGKNLSVWAQPMSNYTPSDTALCLSGNSFTFTNNTTISSGTFTSFWKFGDIATSALFSPQHSYSTVGNYSVVLVVTSDHACKDSTTKIITVNSCLGDVCVNSSGNKYSIRSGMTNYKWSVLSGGNITSGGSTTDTFVVVSWTSAGSHIVKVVFTKPSSLKDSTLFPINVRPLPVADFTINNSSQCRSGNNFVFTNASTGAINYLWRFGDGATSNSISPSHGYSSVGTFSIKLLSTTTYGCKDSITKPVNVRPQPVAGFNINNNSQCLSGNNFGFANTSSGAISFLWNFGDAATTNLVSPSHAYTSAGAFSVKLVSTTIFGCKDSITKSLDVRPQPVSSFTINNNSQCLSGNNFIFTNTATGASTYLWKFGDAATSTATSPSHSYASVGAFTVKLISTTTYGCKDSVTRPLDVRPQPVSGFTINNSSQCLSGNNFVFTNTATGASTYLWNFGDASISALSSPSHSYTTAAAFTVKLISTTAFGCKDSNTKNLNVRPQPVSDFTINNNSQCLSGNSFAFTNTATGANSYLWNFGDAATSGSVSPSHTYTSAGTFTVKLISTSIFGCKDSNTKVLDVRPQPVSGFTINNNSQCLNGNNFDFTNTATGASIFSWNFGDASTSAITSPSHNYTSVGLYSVKLVATTTFGCKDSITKTLNVRLHPVSSFIINDSNQCLNGNNFIFTNKALGATSYIWNFGDAVTSNAFSPSHSYTTADTLSVKLVAISAFGCKDSINKTVYVFPNPIAKFANYDSAQCLERNNFGFVNQSTIASGSMTYFWRFGDGNSSILTDPSHSYLAAGLYTVKMNVLSDLGCTDSFARFTFLHIDPEPTAAYSVNDSSQCFSGNSFIFTNNSTITSGSITPLWNFDDGNTSASISDTHSFITNDTFLVKLLVISDKGCKDSVIHKMIVSPLPQVGFSVLDTIHCLAGNQFSFVNTTSISSGPITFSWNFGDGKSSVDTSPVHIYSLAGIYQVILKVTSGLGCTDSASKMIYVYPPPAAAFSYLSDSSQCLTSNSFRMLNNTTVPAGSFSSFWDFGDGSTSIDTNGIHSYATADSFYIKLVVNTSYGCTDSITKQVRVNPMPTADFSINDSIQCFNGNDFIFTNKSVIKNGNIYLKWHFGDGDSSAYLTPSHIYKKVDSFLVSLSIHSKLGCADTITKRVEVMPKPIAGYTINDTAQCLLGNSYAFTDTSSISKGMFFRAWTFGDTDTSSLSNPIHSYTFDDSFHVRLVIESAFGCTDTMIKRVFVYPSPQVTFSVNDSDQCLKGNSFTFTNSTRINNGIVNYSWDLADGTLSNQVSPTHSYLTNDTFTVKLLAASTIGCADSMSKTVYTFAMPASSFTVNDSSQCFNGNSFLFTNKSNIISGSYVNNWQFGDADTSTSINPAHSYSTSDSFKAELLLTSNHGCTDKTSKMLYVNPMPTAAFSINDTDQCFNGNSFDFVNNSSIKSGLLSYNWNLGDATISTLLDVTHSYAIVDSYAIKLVVQSPFGCNDSMVKYVYVRSQPTAGFLLSDTVQCFKGNSFSFINSSILSSGNILFNWSFGDGDTSTAKDPIHSFSQPDSFEVMLLTSTDFNCIDSFKKKVYVNPSPIASFYANSYLQYLPYNKFVFTNTSLIGSGINNYIWDFGDGNTTVLTDPDHIYNVADTFEVMLIANSDKGCIDTVKKFVYVRAATVIADFSVTNVCKGDTVFFKNTSQIVNDTFVNFVWDFGDTVGTVKIENPYHIYKNLGTYTVTMIAISKNGYKDTMSHIINILPSPLLSIPNDTTIYDGQKITLTAIGVFDKVEWSTGAQTAGIEVDTQGIYSVIITDSNGCKAYGSVRVIVLERKGFSYTTIITPNGDGLNDFWKVFDVEQYQPCKLAIYNRWGDELYSNSNYKNDWDGKYKGKTLPEGAYYFVLETKDKKVFKGAINILK